MSDFALDPITRDLILPPRVISGAEKVAQSVGIRLRCWLGEWFLDLDHGVPYLTNVLGRQRPEMVEAVLRQQVLGVDGVTSIIAFDLAIDPATRKAEVRFEAATDAGTASDRLVVSF